VLHQITTLDKPADKLKDNYKVISRVKETLVKKVQRGLLGAPVQEVIVEYFLSFSRKSEYS